MEIDYLLLISRTIHLLAAMIAIGGAVFMRAALVPLATELDDESHNKLREGVRRRWAKIVQPCIALLLITGGLNFYLLALAPKVDPMPYHGLFGLKFIMAMSLFFLASALVGKSPAFERIRARPRHTLNLILLLAVLIVILSGVLGQIRSA